MLCCIIYSFAGFAIALVLIGFIYRKSSGVCSSNNRMDGKTVIITGASAGIGMFTARDLANRGAKVILACRNVQKAEKVKDWIISETGNRKTIVCQIDVADLDSVRKFAKEIIRKEERLDVLINNAGLFTPEREESPQGFELTYATNHLGHFLLTNLLLGLLKKSSPSRIINVSALAHILFNLDLDDIHFKKRKYGFIASYTQSKLCNILFTKELANLLAGTGVSVNALHPGLIASNFVRKKGNLFESVLNFLASVVVKDSNLGAQTTIHLAVSDEVNQISGEYFSDCKVVSTSKKALDPGLAKKLWEISEEEAGLRQDEKYF